MATNKHIIDVQTRGAKKSEKQIKGVSGALGGMAKQIGLAAAAYFGTSGLINGIKSSTDAFAKQELAEKKLRFAAGASTNELIKQAQALQQTTRFGDEAIIGQQAYVKSLGVSTEQTKEIIAASVDLAAAMGISLESAVMNTTKTLSGMQGELGEKLPAAFKELTAEQLKAGDGIVFIREQFRGTAEEETQTLTGALDQMSNAFGDLQERIGERLAPALGNLANKFKDIITIDPSQEAIKEKQEFETLLGVMLDVNAETSSRELAIKDLEKSYKPYLKDLNLEKATTEDLIKLKNDVVTQMQEEIKQKLFAEQLREAEQKKQEASIKLYQAEQEQVKQATMTYNGYGGMVTHLGNQTGVVVQQRKKAFEEAEKELQAVKDSQVGYEEWLKTQNKVVKVKDADAKTTKELTSFEKALAKVKEQTTAKGASDEYSAALNSSKAHLIKQIMKHIRFPFNIAVAAGAGASIDKIFAKNNITAAQYGADFVTDGPQMMMVGEGSGPERVQVTPLVDPNLDGPQGSGMTINIQGSVIGTEQFTEDVLMPQIEEGLRLGNRI